MAFLSDADIQASLLERYRWSLADARFMGCSPSPYGDPRETGEHSPICPQCAPRWSRYLAEERSLPMMTGPYGGTPDNAHRGVAARYARFLEWLCANGHHGTAQKVSFR